MYIDKIKSKKELLDKLKSHYDKLNKDMDNIKNYGNDTKDSPDFNDRIVGDAESQISAIPINKSSTDFKFEIDKIKCDYDKLVKK